MKIINHNLPILFKDIPIGGIFQSDKSPSMLYIKTHNFLDANDMDYNAIDITSGDFACINVERTYFYFPDVAIYLQGVNK